MSDFDIRTLERRQALGEALGSRLHRARERAGLVRAERCSSCSRQIRCRNKRPKGRLSCARPSRPWCWGVMTDRELVALGRHVNELVQRSVTSSAKWSELLQLVLPFE